MRCEPVRTLALPTASRHSSHLDLFAEKLKSELVKTLPKLSGPRTRRSSVSNRVRYSQMARDCAKCIVRGDSNLSWRHHARCESGEGKSSCSSANMSSSI